MSIKKQKKDLEFKDWCSRSAALDPAIIDETARTIRTLMTTEEPALVADWGRWEIIREILLMSGCQGPDSNELVLLDNHSRYGAVADLIKGSARDLAIDQTGYWGNTCFSSLAEREWTLAKEGHLKSVSIGYKTFDEFSFVLKPGERGVVEGREFVNDYADKRTLIIRTKWEPKELSLVPIGADKNARFRSINTLTDDDMKELKSILGIEDRSEPENENKNNDSSQIQIINQRSPEMDEKERKELEDRLRRDETARQNEIRAIADKFKNNYKKGAEGVRAAIESGMSIDDFRREVFDNFDDSKPVSTPVTAAGMTQKDIDKFSITRAINAHIEASVEKHGRGWDGAGFENEVISDVKNNLKRSGIVYEPKGVILPFETFGLGKRMMPHMNMGKRAMSVGSATAGGNLVGTDHLGGEFIGLLRNKMVTGLAGARILSGLTSNLDIPKQTGSATFSFTAESAAVAASQMTIGQLSLTPKEGKAATTYGRKLFRQTSPAVDGLITDDLVSIAKLGMDGAALTCAGSSNDPTGVLHTTGVGSIVGAGMNWGKIVDFETAVANANADVDTMKWIASPSVRGMLKQAQQGVNLPFIWEKDNSMNGYEALTTKQAGEDNLFFGDWSKLWIANWGVIDIVPLQLDLTGNITLLVFVLCDVGVTVAGSFCVAESVSLQ